MILTNPFEQTVVANLEFATREGLLPAILLMILPFAILWALVKLLPPWPEETRTLPRPITSPQLHLLR